MAKKLPKITADEQKLVFETPHTSRRDETRRGPTSENRPGSSRCLVCGDHNGLPCDGPGFDSRLKRCKNRASRHSQGTLNGVPSLNDLAIDGA